MSFTLGDGHQVLGEWTMHYLPPGGGRYTGKLTVTGRRLLFAASLDISLVGALAPLVSVEGGRDYLVIPKASIRSVEVRRSLLNKRVLVTVEGGGLHPFDYGALPVDKVAAAIKQR